MPGCESHSGIAAPRKMPNVSAELDVGSLHLDLAHYEATFGGRPLDLTPREFDFLAYLARYVGKVCTRRMIL